MVLSNPSSKRSVLNRTTRANYSKPRSVIQWPVEIKVKSHLHPAGKRLPIPFWLRQQGEADRIYGSTAVSMLERSKYENQPMGRALVWVQMLPLSTRSPQSLYQIIWCEPAHPAAHHRPPRAVPRPAFTAQPPKPQGFKQPKDRSCPLFSADSSQSSPVEQVNGAGHAQGGCAFWTS